MSDAWTAHTNLEARIADLENVVSQLKALHTQHVAQSVNLATVAVAPNAVTASTTKTTLSNISAQAQALPDLYITKV